jgi:hypothetical protein
VECLFVQESSYVTIQNSSFTNCGIMDVYVHEIGGGGDPDHITIQINAFTTTADGGYYTLVTQALSGESLNDYLIQGNSFAQTPLLENDPGSTVSNYRFCSATNTGMPFKSTYSPVGVTTSC